MVNAGTPGSKAPEQLKARHTKTPYDKKVDIYTYGLVLFYLLTDGHKPFEEIKNAFERDKIVEEVRRKDDVFVFTHNTVINTKC